MAGTVIDTESPADIIHQIDANYYLSLVAFTILYYDYALTLPDEVRFIWKKKTSLVTGLFYTNRYLSILGTIPIVLQSFGNWSAKGCDDLQKYHQFLSIIVQIIVAVIVILRTYALYECSLKVLLSMSSFAVIVICFVIWAVLAPASTVQEQYDLSSMLGCNANLSFELAAKLSGAWASLLVFDTAVVILTLRKAIIIKKLENRKLFYVLIRDGTVYYFVFAMINMAQIIIFLTGAPIVRGVLTTLANVISTTLISRLMLNLQNPRLFHANNDRTAISTLGAFVARVPDQSTVSSGLASNNTLTDESTRYASSDGGTWTLPNRSHIVRKIDIQQDIELSVISDHTDGDLK
ncbi:uncharacterized protein FOMMEDRAFT_105557 [Fomitiporia mediterranea MF3/22]|uniref:uncharacterized protein n=1 Tax=Fomitiporia mediterranea (strain MF3/22) TaxID=694068 RepID=UPI0004409881|nr:uncharacterized protein FOMMEDRAFT_105557 [Fomitiporia mediterranea MF3/22]EJD03495.1 hypothetical protein FOMMEDRAFT_105557 [Fomitiporia mediterranea MF3/22]